MRSHYRESIEAPQRCPPSLPSDAPAFTCRCGQVGMPPVLSELPPELHTLAMAVVDVRPLPSPLLDPLIPMRPCSSHVTLATKAATVWPTLDCPLFLCRPV